jgi:hypothetical protein
MLINLKMKSSSIFRSKVHPEGEELEEAELHKLNFPCHCKKGIIDNALQLYLEFNEAR